MAFSFLYLVVRALPGALVRSRRGLHVKDVELLVLRHELEILRPTRRLGVPASGMARRRGRPRARARTRAARHEFVLAGGSTRCRRPAQSERGRPSNKKTPARDGVN